MPPRIMNRSIIRNWGDINKYLVSSKSLHFDKNVTLILPLEGKPIIDIRFIADRKSRVTYLLASLKREVALRSNDGRSFFAKIYRNFALNSNRRNYATI